MTDSIATKTYDVSFTATATGDGHWGMEGGTIVTFTKLVVDVTTYSGGTTYTGGQYALLWAEHDKDAQQHGLCYTDSGIEDSVNEFIRNHPELSQVIESVCGSEQGMQADCVLSMDIVLKNVDNLEKLGYEIQEN